MKTKEIFKAYSSLNEGTGLNLFNYLERYKHEITLPQKMLIYVLNVCAVIQVTGMFACILIPAFILYVTIIAEDIITWPFRKVWKLFKH